MSKIKHHLTEPLLMGYSAGTLPEAFNLVVATHVSMCDDCRAAVAEYDALGGEVMLDTQPITMDAASLAATFALIDKGVPAPTAKPRARRISDAVAGLCLWRSSGREVAQSGRRRKPDGPEDQR